MYNRVNQVLEQYPFVVEQTHKGRGALILETDQGLKILKEYNGSEGRADFLYKILTFLAENGQKRVDCIVKTKEERTIAIDTDETVYMVRDWYEGRECDSKNRDDIQKSVRQLADIHNTFHSFPEEVPEFLVAPPDQLLMEYEKHIRELKKVKNYIGCKKKKNDFEMEYARHCDRFLEQAARVTAGQRADLGTDSGAQELRGMCHGDFNHHNVIFSKEGISVLNYEKAVFDVQAADLGNFMRKIMEKHNWNLGLGMDMLDAYSRLRPLGAAELRQLYFRLAFPEKFWKISNHYYNTSKAWVCMRDLEKLMRVEEQEEAKERFLKVMSYNILF